MPRLFIAKRSWTKEEDNLLRSLTSSAKYGYKDMVQFFPGRTQASIVCRANQKLKIVNHYEYRRWEYNNTYFHVPTIENSYIAGFLAADGCVHVRTGNYGYCLILGLSNLDIEHLTWIRNAIGYKGPIIEEKNKRMSYFKITISESYKNDLANNFGVVHQKTYRYSPPTHLTYEQRFAYMIGMLDGDGCVHLGKNNCLSIGLTSSAVLSLEWLKSLVDNMGLKQLRYNKTKARITKCSHANAFHLGYSGARAVCLVQLAQEFARRHNLPILARKWNNPRLNQYISDFYARFPDYRFDAATKLDELIAANSSSSL
jgi:hypothetical protein